MERCIELAGVAYAATATGRALDSSLGHVVAPDGEFHIKSSGLFVDGRLFVAVKVAAFFEHRPRTLGLPSIVGLIQLYDGATGQPLAVMESGLITNLRTAAGTAVALDRLAPPEARRLLVCGAGAQVLPHVDAITTIRDLESVQLWGRSSGRTETTAAELRARFPRLPVDIVHDVGRAAAAADLIACLTPSTTPYLHAANVRPGTTIAAIGSDTPDKQELSIDLLWASALVCDVTDQCAAVGELHHALDAGVVTLADVRAEIGQVIAGSATGRNPTTRSSSSTRPAPRFRTPRPLPPSTSRQPARRRQTSGGSDERTATTIPDDRAGLIRGRRTRGRSSMAEVKNIVLVHGGFVDGSGWRGVYDVLRADGFNVSVVQNQTLSLASDVETTDNVLDALDGPAILVGHSYGGVVITEAGRHERVAGLAYIAAFAPDAGESVNTLIANPPPGAPVPPILPSRDGFLYLDRDKFAASFAADLPAGDAAFMADSQVPWGVEALEGAVTEPTWRSKLTWYLVATDDHMIPPPAQRAMAERAGATVAEEAGSHSIYVSQTQATAALIGEAARRALAETTQTVA